MRKVLDHQVKRLRGRVYSIGIYTGTSPLALASPAAAISNPVLTRDSVTDVLATLVADPFMLRVDETWYMFFEAVSWRPGSKKGEIGFATSKDGLHWEYQGIVLVEPFHLSFPCVFEWGSDHYMVPESTAAGSVRLYRADPFPTRWVFVKNLVTGPVHLDSSLFHHDDRWWMFTHTDERLGTLRLLHAQDLRGPWSEHPKSPVVAADRRIARPAGRVISMSGRLFRFAQDCRATYGGGVVAIEVTRLGPREYEESVLDGASVLTGTANGWNSTGMHHVDPHQLEDGSWIACVDGWCSRLRRPREILQKAMDCCPAPLVKLWRQQRR